MVSAASVEILSGPSTVPHGGQTSGVALEFLGTGPEVMPLVLRRRGLSVSLPLPTLLHGQNLPGAASVGLLPTKAGLPSLVILLNV